MLVPNHLTCNMKIKILLRWIQGAVTLGSPARKVWCSLLSAREQARPSAPIIRPQPLYRHFITLSLISLEVGPGRDGGGGGPQATLMVMRFKQGLIDVWPSILIDSSEVRKLGSSTVKRLLRLITDELWIRSTFFSNKRKQGLTASKKVWKHQTCLQARWHQQDCDSPSSWWWRIAILLMSSWTLTALRMFNTYV